ncbi:MAG: ribose-phosphate diphosphokinase, partial [Pseudomonadota bacterium]
ERLEVRSFPDGESLVRAPAWAPTTILYGSLDDPDVKLVRLILAAAALRDLGARRLVLVTPYLCYMRQDVAFREGEAVSQRVIGGLLAERFDRVVTVDPHLHRVASLSEALPGIEATTLTAAPLLGAALAGEGAEPPLLAGPDAESRQWVEQIARPKGLDFVIASKIRRGDRDVQVDLPEAAVAKGRRVVIVDDVISSGATMMALAGLLARAGATRVEAVATHDLSTPQTREALRAAGISRVQATDSVPRLDADGPMISLAPLLAEAIQEDVQT